MTLTTRKGDVVVENDEYIRHDASAETMAKLKPAFHQGWHGHRRQRLGH